MTITPPTTSPFDDVFSGAPLMAILRGMGRERSIALATTAWDLGIDSVEVGVVLSGVTFVVVSRMTRPTPPDTLRIFFDDAPLSRSQS